MRERARERSIVGCDIVIAQNQGRRRRVLPVLCVSRKTRLQMISGPLCSLNKQSAVAGGDVILSLANNNKWLDNESIGLMTKSRERAQLTSGRASLRCPLCTLAAASSKARAASLMTMDCDNHAARSALGTFPVTFCARRVSGRVCARRANDTTPFNLSTFWPVNRVGSGHRSFMRIGRSKWLENAWLRSDSCLF